MRLITIPIICLGFVLTTILLGIRLLTIHPIFGVIYSSNVTSDSNQSAAAFTLSQTIFNKSALQSTADFICNNKSFCLSVNEISHMADVAQLISFLVITTIIVDIAVILFFRKQYLRTAILINIIFSVIIIAAAFFLWQFFFIQFHKIFFQQGNWAFPPDSALIQLYPDKFWQFNAILLIAVILFIHVITFITITSRSIFQRI